MQGFEVITENIITLALAILVGFICVKTNYITDEQNKGMSRIIVRVTLPILVLTSLTSLDFDREKLTNSAYVLITSLIIIAVLYIIGCLTSKGMEKPKAVMQSCMMCFGNVVFMAFPLIKALYGAEGLLYAAVYELANDMLLWTVGVYRMSGADKGKSSFWHSLRNMLNPGTIAFLTAFIMMIFGLKFTGVVGTVLDGIGSVTTYMSMFFIGGTLARVDFRHIYKRARLFLLTFIKMLLVPALLILLLRFLDISDTARAVIILQTAMPTSTVLAVLGSEYGGDTLYCAEGIFITHLFGLVTLPLIYLLMTSV